MTSGQLPTQSSDREELIQKAIQALRSTGIELALRERAEIVLRAVGATHDYRQAALELNAEIRHGLAWIGSGCEPHVAHVSMLKTAEKWRALLEDETDA